MQAYAYTSKVVLTEGEKEWVRLHPDITIGIEESWAPLVIKNDDGTLTGIDVDTLDYLNTVLGTNIHLILGKWSKLNEMLRNNQIDGLASSSIDAERSEYAYFTKPYTKTLKSIFVKKGNPLNIATPESMIGKRVAIQEGNIFDEKVIRKHSDVIVVWAKNYRDLPNKILSGQADAFIGADMSFYNIIDMGITSIEPAFNLGDPLELSYAIRKDWPELVDILNKGIITLSEEKRISIKNRYVKRKPMLDYLFIWKIILCSAVAVLVLLLWNRLLARKVRHGIEEYEKQKTILNQQAKMAAVGEMMAAIAHQWKQPLNVISMSAQQIEYMTRRDDIDFDKLKNASDNIVSKIDFMSETIDDFRNFYIPSKKKQMFVVCASIKVIERLFKGVFEKANIQLNIHSHDHFQVYGYPNEFQQVILNILNNARDIFIERKIDGGKIDCFFEKTDSKGIIRLRDNGGGLSLELLPDKLFDIYVSTKEKSGEGFGLYISKVIIEDRMHGKLWAHNVECGAEFVIELPLTDLMNG